MFSQPEGRGGCLLPRPQGIIELALSHALPAHLVLPSEAHATSTHLGVVLREQVSHSVHLEGGPLLGGESHLCSWFGEQVSSQQGHWALRNVEEFMNYLVPPSPQSDIFWAGKMI